MPNFAALHVSALLLFILKVLGVAAIVMVVACGFLALALAHVLKGDDSEDVE